jgi:hypothetical protein
VHAAGAAERLLPRDLLLLPRLPLVPVAAGPHPQRVLRRVPHRVQQPRADHRPRRQRPRLARQDDEHGLRHVLGQVPIPHLADGGRVDEVDVPGHEQRERPLRPAGGVVAEQLFVADEVPVGDPLELPARQIVNRRDHATLPCPTTAPRGHRNFTTYGRRTRDVRAHGETPVPGTKPHWPLKNAGGC